METILYTIAGMLSVYLYADKFLFRGRLGTLFVEGWRELLGAWFAPLGRFARGKRRPQRQVSESAPELAERICDEGLVVGKRYGRGLSVPAGDIARKTVPNPAGSDTFAPASTLETEPEVMEWRAPSFRPKKPEKTPPTRWEEKGFAARFIERDDQSGEVDLVPVVDAEQIRQEVAASLEQIRDDELRQELEPTDDEKYGIEEFDVAAYR